MLENSSNQLKTVWFFISRLSILAGMVLVFSVLGFALGGLICKLLLGVDVFADPAVFSTFDQNPTALGALKILQVVATLVGMIIPAWFFPKAIEQQSSSFLQLNGHIKPIYWVAAIGLVFISIPLVSWLVEMNERLQFPASWSGLEQQLKASENAAVQLTKAFITSHTTGELLVNVAVVAIIPAIAEELLFRGALQQFFVYCFKNVHVAVILSAAIFSAFHGQVYGFMPRWVLGVLLGYLFAYSRSVWPGVLAHFMNNALSLLVAHFTLEQSQFSFLQDDYHFPVYAIVISIAGCLSIIYFLSKNPSAHAGQLD